jgi:hypothetical protein
MEMERIMQQMLQQLVAHQGKANVDLEQMKADRIADQEERKADQDDLKGMMEEMNAKMDINQAKATKQEEIPAEISARMDTNPNEMGEEIKSGQAQMRSTLDEWLMDMKDGRKETTACNEATETKLDPGLMQSIEEHQDSPKGEVAVMQKVA